MPFIQLFATFLKATAQAVGRVLRHKDDYAAIILLALLLSHVGKSSHFLKKKKLLFITELLDTCNANYAENNTE